MTTNLHTMTPPDAPPEMTPSASSEAKYHRLIQQEKRINLSFVDVGVALQIIRDEKLWQVLDEYDTFDSYCQTRLDIRKSQASKWINAALVTLEMREQLEIELPNKTVAYQIHLTPERIREGVVRRAQQMAHFERKPRMTSAHVRRARMEFEGDIPDAVNELADELGVTDAERVMILARWHDESGDYDSKWAAVRYSGVLDPGDDGAPVVFASATIAELLEIEKRWDAVESELDKPRPFEISGIFNELKLNGQRVREIDGISLAGREVRLRIDILNNDD